MDARLLLTRACTRCAALRCRRPPPPSPSRQDSFLAEGFILDKKIGVGQPKRLVDAKVLIANTPMDSDKIKIYGARVRVDSMAKVVTRLNALLLHVLLLGGWVRWQRGLGRVAVADGAGVRHTQCWQGAACAPTVRLRLRLRRAAGWRQVGEIEAAEKAKMRQKCEKIIGHGINCFVNRQLIYNFPEEIFADAGGCRRHARRRRTR